MILTNLNNDKNETAKRECHKVWQIKQKEKNFRFDNKTKVDNSRD